MAMLYDDDPVLVRDTTSAIPSILVPSEKKPGGMFRWVTCVFCSLALLLSLGAALNLNLFIEEIRESFQINYSDASWVISVSVALIQGFGPISAVILESFGYRQSVIAAGIIAGICQFAVAYIHNYALLVVVLGLMYGIAHSVTMVGCVAAPGFLFDDSNRHVAMSIVFTGIALAQTILPLLYNHLNEMYTWRGSMMVVGGLTLNIVATGALLPTDVKEGVSLKDRLNLRMWKQPPFIALMIASFLVQFVGVGMGVFYFSLLNSQYGLTKTKTALVLTIFGILMIVGRLAVSLLKQRERLPRWVVWCVNCSGMFICIILLGQCRSFAAAVTIMMFNGFLIGALYPIHAIVICDLFSISQLANVFGYANLAFGVGSLTGPPVVGKLRDVIGSYDVPSLAVGLTGLVPFLGAILFYIGKKLRR